MMHDAIGHGYVRVRKVVAVASVINESRPVVGPGHAGRFAWSRQSSCAFRRAWTLVSPAAKALMANRQLDLSSGFGRASSFDLDTTRMLRYLIHSCILGHIFSSVDIWSLLLVYDTTRT
jgi:hypothetical protein